MKTGLLSSETITRRSWAAIVATTAAPALAQVTSTPPPQGAPKPPQSPATPETRLQKAVAEVRQASDRLAQMEVPMDIEPAFAFRAVNG